MNKYIPTIGIECHVQLSTKTKLFASVDNDARDKEPNTTVSPVCFGLPGTLPVLNSAAIEFGIRAGIALNAKINSVISFDRKHYFYPDLPKGYQITQMYQPIILEGYVELPGLGKKVKIHHAHLEEDAGKNTHPSGTDYSLVDLNRAGTPLLEIVSEPDMHSAEEARSYAYELYLLMKYAKVSDVDLYHGNMRFDVNVSLAEEGSNELGIRTETKNLNSFKSVERAVNYEIKRQSEVLNKGEQVAQETRGWDEAKQKTISQRGKEFAHDYRYMPEPDVPPFEISTEYINAVSKKLPKLPADYRKTFEALQLDNSIVETLMAEPAQADMAMQLIGYSEIEHARRIVLWLTQLKTIDDSELTDLDKPEHEKYLPQQEFLKLSKKVSNNEISSTNAKIVFNELLRNGGTVEKIVSEKNLSQVSDETEIEKIVDQVIAENESAAKDVRNGEAKAIGFLVGQVMKQSQGQANPQIVNKLLRDKLKAQN